MPLASSAHKQQSATAPQHQTMQDGNKEQQIEGQPHSNQHPDTIANVTQPSSANTSHNYAHPHSQYDSPLLTSSTSVTTTKTSTTLDFSGNPPPPDLQPQKVSAPTKAKQPWEQQQGDKSRWKTMNGKTLIEARPGWRMVCLMLPIPCFFMGCCISSSADMLFDDNTRECTIRTWKGYCMCCRSSAKVIPYGEIANFALKPAGCQLNRLTSYEIHLVTKGGNSYCISEPAHTEDLQEKLLAYHAFLFSRGNPAAYKAPNVHELVVE